MEEMNIAGFGNCKPDQAFLAKMKDADLLEVVDPDGPDALPYGAMVRYNGDPDVEGSPYFIPPEGNRCKGKSWVRDGEGRYIILPDGRRMRRPCMQWPIRGGTGVCMTHGGGTQKALAAARLRMLSAVDAVSGALVKIALDEKMDARVRVAAINSILDRAGLRAGVDVSVEVKPWQMLLQRLDADVSRANGTIIEGEEVLEVLEVFSD